MARGRARAAPDARAAALRILQRVDSGDAYASLLLDHEQPALRDPREGRLLRELVLGVLRRRSILDHVIETLSGRSVDRLDPPVRAALRAGTYEILFLDRVPAFASVDRAVELVKHGPSRAAAGLVNAVLRRVAREGRERLPAAPASGDTAALALYHAHPRWWVERLVARAGATDAARLLEADNLAAAPVLALNRARTRREALARRLREEGVITEPCVFAPDALRVREGTLTSSRALADGWCWVQDEASQLVALLAGEQPGPRVADLCAAPGGKTMALLARLPAAGRVLACDRSPARLRRLDENLRRIGARERVDLLAVDLVRPGAALAATFDDVLLDAPCTGTGTLRRHPEIRWRLRPEDPARLAVLQGRLLDAAAALVRPGGRLVYSVCSLEPEEGQGARDAFLERNPAFRIEDPRPGLPAPARALVDPSGALRTAPDRGGLDGFFAALLVRDR